MSTTPTPATPTARPPVAIVGMSVLLPGARDLDSYWANLVEGKDCITDVPRHRWDPIYFDPAAGVSRPDRLYCNRGGFVDDDAEVDAASFGVMPSSVAGAEPDQLIALKVAAAAIADAGGSERMPAGDRTGVVIGRGGYLTPGIARLDQRVRTASQLIHTLQELIPDITATQLEQVRQSFTEQLGPHSPDATIGLVPNLAASRIANRLNLRGPAYTVDAACASSLIAVDQAVAELASGRCDAVIAGGVHHCHDVTFWSVFCQLGALSRGQQIRPFDQAADGILIGEGTAMVVLKRLDDAVAAGDRIYAVVRGTGVSSDGRAASLFSPEAGGQVLALRRAWEAAGLDPREPDSIGMLEAHGTATVAGDGAELSTLVEVFGAGHPAVIGSVKSMIGHTMPTAGVAGLVKIALALHHKKLLPTLHCDNPHPMLADTRFRPIAQSQPWLDVPLPRRGAVNAFGFGGINAHVVVEEAPNRPASAGSSAEPVLRLAATDPAALLALLEDEAGWAAQVPAGAPCRLAIVDPTPKKVAMAKRIVAKGIAWRGRNDIWFSPQPLLETGRTAFVFPGLEPGFSPQIADLEAHFGEQAAESVSDGTPTEDVGRHGLGVVWVGRYLHRALARMDLHADAMAGYSVGEWTAMITSGMYSVEQADAFLDDFDPDSLEVPGLVFAAIGAGADSVKVRNVLERFPAVALSHDNSPNQCVLCGPEAQIAEVMTTLRAAQVICHELPFRSGFHTPMLEPYLGPIRAAAEEFDLHPPAVPLWSATTVAPFPADPDAVREIFVRHILEPVRFRELVEALYADGIRAFVIVGAGQLSAVIDDVLRDHEHLAIAANTANRSGLAQLRRVAAAFWVEGKDVNADVLEPAAVVEPAIAREPAVKTAKPVAARLPIRLNLGADLVSLPAGRRPVLVGSGERVRGGYVSGSDSHLGELDRMSHSPAAAELASLLRETASGAVALLQAPVGSPHVVAPRPSGPVSTSSTLRVSVDEMPYLVDHCFFKQREDWPEIADRWPIVPATTLIHHAMVAAEAAAVGNRAVGVRKARFKRWVTAVPEVDVAVSVTPLTDNQVRVELHGYAEAIVELSPTYAPAPRPLELADGPLRESPITAEQLYSFRWMFHGPMFQAVSEIVELGPSHVGAMLRMPEAPGALLDNVGQVLGLWVSATLPTRTVVFPVGMERISFHGDLPRPGAELYCLVRIRSVTDTELLADAQLLVDGRVLVEMTGWLDRRFDSFPSTVPVDRAPEVNTLSEAQPGGWAVVYERWPDLATRELQMRNHLSSQERAQYELVAPRQRRSFLLGRIAVKDAVRHQLWNAGAGPLFPAELLVTNDDAGRPHVRGNHTDAVGEPSVSLAHSGEVGVAIARPAGTPVGIDVQAITEHPDSTVAFALSATERDLLERTVTSTGESMTVWFNKFFAAKEAVSKLRGTGLRGNPQRFAVLAADADCLTVETEGSVYAVHMAMIANPEDLPQRSYVVAWTEQPAQTSTGSTSMENNRTAERGTP